MHYTKIMNNKIVRQIDILVLSDIHLGTYGCHAKELLNYLKTVDPKIVILNGDIIDIWQFSKRYWPKSHMKILKKIISYTTREIPVYYITGNHDELLRKFTDFNLGSFYLLNELELVINGKKTWFIHGDYFDISMRYSKSLAKIGGKSYDLLILLNRLMNNTFKKNFSMSKTIKQSVKKAIKYISDFEKLAVEFAAKKNCEVVCNGHIHNAKIHSYDYKESEILYLNSGDWVESLTSLEFYNGEWHLYKYQSDPLVRLIYDDIEEDFEVNNEREINPYQHLLSWIK